MQTDTPQLKRLLAGLDRLNAVRKCHLCALTALWLLLAAAAVLLLCTLADIWLAVPPAALWSFFIMICGTIGITVVATIRQALRHVSHQKLAVIVETAQPEADNAIINAVQLAENGSAQPATIDAILSANTVKPADVSVWRTYPRAWLTHLAWVLPLMVLLFALPAVLVPQRLQTSLQRVLQPYKNLPPYTETYLNCILPGSCTVRRGDTITITAELTGKVPDHTYVEWRHAATEGSETFRMATDNAEGTNLTYTTEPIFEAVDYRILANDAVSDWFSITVDNPPGLENWDMHIVPPSYTGKPDYTFNAISETREIIGGSTIRFAAVATRLLTESALLCDQKPLATVNNDTSFNQFQTDAVIPATGTLSVSLVCANGLSATLPLPVTILPDKLPAVALVNTPTAIKVHKNDTITVTFAATDDYGLASVVLEQLLPDNRVETIASSTPSATETTLFRARFVIDMNTFDASAGSLRFRLRAYETASDVPERTGLSPIISVLFFTDEEARQNRSQQAQENKASLEALLVLQKNALKTTNDYAVRATAGTLPEATDIAALAALQTTIRTQAIEILKHRDMLGAIGDTLAGMVNKEFVDVIAHIDTLNRLQKPDMPVQLQQIAALQTRIIALLTSMTPQGIATEEVHQNKADLFSLIDKLVKDQTAVIKLTNAGIKAQGNIDTDRLTAYQETISKGILQFIDKALQSAEDHAKDDFSAKLRKACDILEDGKTYSHSQEACDALEDSDLSLAADIMKTTLKGLAEAYTLLNQWRLDKAKKTVSDAVSTLAELKEALNELEQRQAKITEIVKELKARGAPDDPDLQAELESIAKQHEAMLDDIEKLANDLYQFPDLPICGELNSKMREIFEDVLQAKDSEKLGAVEIAVQKEDSLLDAIRATKERVEDVEMWLPDFTDHFVWNMESFDTDEFPEIPLVELPEELEDIVGELLDQDSDIDAQSQDTTGNNIVADMEMGWMVMDGPMPSFAAKGKTGNTRPNDNEMTGRSGSGREGQATGELVENHVKGYEGRKTHARKTDDKFQKGKVTEDENSTMDARATGGGKLGGDSESIGMFGNAPRRDLDRPAHGKSPRELRRETDVMYAKARLLYVNPGSLGEVAHQLSGFGNTPPDLKSFESVRKKVVRRLSDSVIEMREGTVLPMPVDAVTKHHADGAAQRQGESVSDEYKASLNSYYKSLGH